MLGKTCGGFFESPAFSLGLEKVPVIHETVEDA
jgi:hypothetical protein